MTVDAGSGGDPAGYACTHACTRMYTFYGSGWAENNRSRHSPEMSEDKQAYMHKYVVKIYSGNTDFAIEVGTSYQVI